MNIEIIPSHTKGILPAISSKSDVHRIMICASLCDAPTVIKNVSLCDDILATLNCIEALGARVDIDKDARTLTVFPSKNKIEHATLDCRESGSTLRFMLPVAAARAKSVHFTGCGRLPSRPIGSLVDTMQENGISFSAKSLPLDIKGTLSCGIYTLPGNISSQYVTGLLIALSVTEGESKIFLTSPLESASYVDMTLSTLKIFGAKTDIIENGYIIHGTKALTSPKNIVADGDWSNSAFFLACGAINGNVTLSGLDINSNQGDKKIFEALQKFNACIKIEENEITVSKSKLKATQINLEDTPDMLPILAVLASYSEGESKFAGAKRLRLKESDRLVSVTNMINSLGGKATIHDDGISVTGTPLKGGTVNSENDHRIVMAASVAGISTQGNVTISGAEAVNKSYPTFFEDFKALGGKFHVI